MSSGTLDTLSALLCIVCSNVKLPSACKTCLLLLLLLLVSHCSVSAAIQACFLETSSSITCAYCMVMCEHNKEVMCMMQD